MLKPGDVVTTIFAYADLTGAKIRPALVVSTEHFNQETRMAVLAMISSKQPQNQYEVTISEWQAAGLKFPSKVCIGRLVTANVSLTKHIGHLSKEDIGIVSSIKNVIA